MAPASSTPVEEDNKDELHPCGKPEKQQEKQRKLADATGVNRERDVTIVSHRPPWPGAQHSTEERSMPSGYKGVEGPFEIPLVDEEPTFEKQRRLSPKNQQLIDEYYTELLELDFIELADEKDPR
ncbi:hypothetical protein NFJ02_13g12800 [Pycnococcus provasolii]